MTAYSHISKGLSVLVLLITLYLAFLFFFIGGFLSVLSAFIQHFMDIGPHGHHPWLYRKVIYLTLAVLLPALVLARFYFVVATRTPSVRYAITGWTTSAIYHAGLTCILIFYLPGTVQMNKQPLHLPLALFSGAALLASVYLLIRYPRPPRLPATAEQVRVI